MSSHQNMLDKYIELLAAPADTSKFVALAILPRILSQDDPSEIRRCWEKMDLQFLDRLLMADDTRQKSSETEAVDLRSVGVNILTAFAGRSELRGTEMYQRIPALITALRNSEDKELRSTILGTLLLLTMTPAGAKYVVQPPSALELAELVTSDNEPESARSAASKLLQILGSSCIIAITSQSVNSESLNPLLNLLSQIFAKSANSHLQLDLLTFFSSVFSSISPSLSAETEDWVDNIYEALQAISMSRQTEDRRSEITILIAALLHIYGPEFLFSNKSNEEKARKFAMLTIQLCTISLTSTLENILRQLTLLQYRSIAARLSADFDIIYFTIIFLLNLEDSTVEKPIKVTPDDILNIHSLLQQTISSTLIFLRDRWDAAFAAGDNIQRGEAKVLGWDTDGGITRDPIVIAAVRCLAVWLREDEWSMNEKIGVLDVLLGLWKIDLDDAEEFGYGRYVSQALQGIVSEESGIDEVVRMGGWNVIESDLLKEMSRKNVDWKIIEVDVDLMRQIVESVTDLNKDSTLTFAISVADVDFPKKLDTAKEDLEVYATLLTLTRYGLLRGRRGGNVSETEKEVLRKVLERHKDAIRVINEIGEENHLREVELLAPFQHEVFELEQLLNV